MKQKHPHYEAIIAWANGEPIEMTCKGADDYWVSIKDPSFSLENQYRVRKEPKPDVVIVQKLYMLEKDGKPMFFGNFELTFDGRTGLLKLTRGLV